jgi:plasmid maintenance system antidote protein VapI
MREALAAGINHQIAAHGITVRGFAEAAGVSVSQVYDVLASRKAATSDWIDRVADFFGVDAFTLGTTKPKKAKRRK